MNQKTAILYIDDEKPNLETFKDAFEGDYEIDTALSAKEALQLIEKKDYALIIADQRMPQMTGIELCEKLISLAPSTMRLILTAYSEPELLLAAIQRGHVHDYIVKPWKKADLKVILDKAITDYEQKKEKLHELEKRAVKIESLESELRSIYDNRGIVGVDSGLKQVMDPIKKAAPTDSTILLLGETGTGKELLAHSIHAESKRAQGPFIPVHCAALAKTLLESELFGHEKGAFTGADQMRVGRFEMAQGGTIFLDEVGEIPMETQVKLLRVLQEREIQRVGGNRLIPINVRLIVATNRDLQEEVRQGRFREDLFYRLNVIRITVPPLRERKEDIPSLAQYFVKKYSAKTGTKLSLSAETLAYLGRYDWPGNVRELQNAMERAVIMSTGPIIEPDDLDLKVDEMLRVEKVDLDKVSESSKSVRDQIHAEEIQGLTSTLREAKGNIAEAARLLGVPRTNLFRKLRKYKLI